MFFVFRTQVEEGDDEVWNSTVTLLDGGLFLELSFTSCF